MIKGKIYTRRKFKDKNGNEWTNYKIYYKGVGFWVSDLDLKNHLSEQEDFLTIDMPVAATKMETKNGEFLKIIPEPEDQKPANTVKEQAAIYSAKKTTEKKVKVYDLNEIIEEAKKNKQKNESQKTEKAKGTKSSKPAANASQQEVKDKTDFIATLLDYASNENTDNRNRKKLHELISQEIEKSRLSKEEVEKIVEEKLKQDQLKNVKKKKYVVEPNPKHVADFMSLFNQRDGLKYLTHDYDEDGQFEIVSLLEKAKRVFDKKAYKLAIPRSLWKIINQFSFDANPSWTSLSKDYKPRKIQVGWSSQEWINWAKENSLHPIRNEKYRNIINAFKKVTRIESPNFEVLVNTCIENIFMKEKDSFEIHTNNLSKADFYTHVGYLKTAIETIFQEIKKHSDIPEKRKFSIRYDREVIDDYFVRKIIIKHFNSFPNKELSLLVNEWNEKGNMGKIKEKLRGYCHWSVETTIEKTPLRVNILREKDDSEVEKIDTSEGFTHILTFYYK